MTILRQPTYKRRCPACKLRFRTTDPRKLYDSNACRQKASRIRAASLRVAAEHGRDGRLATEADVLAAEHDPKVAAKLAEIANASQPGSAQ